MKRKPMIESLGLKKNLEVLQELVTLDSKKVMDVGCGGMSFSKQLAELGAEVLAIDPDSVQAKLNKLETPFVLENRCIVDFVEASAERFPTEDDSQDGIFFVYSLHHIPAEIYPQIFAEVRRVLKPDGFLYVIEPISCPINDVIDLFHNEVEEREAAQQALNNLALPHFRKHKTVTYFDHRTFKSFDEFVEIFASKSFNSIYTEADIRQPIVKETFERLGQPDYRFQSPKLVTFMQGLT